MTGAGRGGKTVPLGYQELSPIRSICVLSDSFQRSTAPVVSWNRNNAYLIGTENGEIQHSSDFGDTWDCVLQGQWRAIRKIEAWEGSSTVVYAVAQTSSLQE
jgi:hypothetical protein